MPATAAAVNTALNIGSGGTIVTQVSADSANGNYFTQDGKTMLRLQNTDASSHTVTFTYPLTVDGQSVTSKVLTLAASEVRYVSAGQHAYDAVYYPNGIITFTANSNLVKIELVTVSP